MSPAEDEPPKLPWFGLVLPGEEPKLFRGRGKWRRRHERIRRLESDVLGIKSPDFPWERYDYGY